MTKWHRIGKHRYANYHGQTARILKENKKSGTVEIRMVVYNEDLKK